MMAGDVLDANADGPDYRTDLDANVVRLRIKGAISVAVGAYNSGDGSGDCFGGFSDNTVLAPSRNWSSSAGTKSVGVTVASDVDGCMVTDFYSFEVVPTMLACPANQTITLITNPGSFDCLAEATFIHPMVVPGPCDPAVLTISVDGGAAEEVIPGESYTAMFIALGTFTVTYNLEDAVGNTTTCSFDITVDGLPCGLADNGGVGCEGSTTTFDQNTASFTLTATDCAPNTMLYTEDGTAFVFTKLCGDGEITTQVTGLNGTGFAGLMLRETDAPNAKKIALGTNNVDRLRKEVRVIDGYPSSAAEIISFSQFWIRVVRSGDTFSGFASTDGIFWQPYLSQTIIMGDCVLAGLYTYSEKPSNGVTATFTDVSMPGLANLGGFAGSSQDNLQGLSRGLSLESIKIFPNPARNLITLHLDQLIGEAATIRIFDMNGQIMQQIELDTVEDTIVPVSVEQLTTGTYIV
ncbi:MAG: T9SS type A sorting domain-containing protein [Bacteroidota bacterium]